jgi:hypothetical protein
MDENLWKKELLTQKEVADYFNVVPGTVKNWRDQRLLSFWQAPGSTRVLYFSNEIRDFRDKNTISKKGGGNQEVAKRNTGIKPDVPSTMKKWRV